MASFIRNPTEHIHSVANYSNGLERQGIQTVQFGSQCFAVTFDIIGKAISAKCLHEEQSTSSAIASYQKYSSTKMTHDSVVEFLNQKELQKLYSASEIERMNQVKLALPEYDALVLSGGGARGLAFTGVFLQLGDERLANIKEVAGSSIGGLAVLPIACGMSADEASNFIGNANPSLNAAAIEKIAVGSIKYKLEHLKEEIYEFLKQHDCPLRNKVGKVVERRDCAEGLSYLTFKQLELLRSSMGEGSFSRQHKLNLKHLVIIATEEIAGKKEEIELSANKSPDLPIITAIRATCGYPIKIGSIKVRSSLLTSESTQSCHGKGKQYAVLSDGGLSNNTPHIYVKGNKKLVVAFNTAEERVSRPQLTVMERLQQRVLGIPFYRYEQYDISEAQSDPNVSLFFIRANVNTFDLEKAKTDLFLNELDVMKQLKSFEETEIAKISPDTGVDRSQQTNYSVSCSTSYSDISQQGSSELESPMSEPIIGASSNTPSSSHSFQHPSQLEAVIENQRMVFEQFHGRLTSPFGASSPSLSTLGGQRRRFPQSQTYACGMNLAAKTVENYVKQKYSPSHSSSSINSEETKKNSR